MGRTIQDYVSSHGGEEGYIGRIEVVTGPIGRRRWPDAVKARIVAETFRDGVSVADIARRHELSAPQLHAWWRRARDGVLPMVETEDDQLGLVPVMVAEGSDEPTSLPRPEDRSWSRSAGSGSSFRPASMRGIWRACCAPSVPRHDPARRQLAVWLATRPVDFRKGHDGLSALVQEKLGQDPFKWRDLRVPLEARRQAEAGGLDHTGLVMVYKRLEGGAFHWPKPADGVIRLTPAQFSALFEGLNWKAVRAERRRRPQLAV